MRKPLLLPLLLMIAVGGWYLARTPNQDSSEGSENRQEAPSAQTLQDVPLVPIPLETSGTRQAAPPELHDPGLAPTSAGDPAEQEAPRETFEVLVLDSNGDPAEDVAIDFVSRRMFGGANVLDAGITDREGKVSFSTQEGATETKRLAGHGFGNELSVAADIPHQDPIRLKLPGLPKPGDTYELTLPPLASVVIEVVGPDGDLFVETPAQVHSRWIPVGEVGIEVYGGYNRCPDAHRKTEAGITRYPWIGLGIVLSTTVSVRGYESGWVSDHPGPQVAGEELRIRIPLGNPQPFLRARLLDSAGAPLANFQVKGFVMRIAEHPEDDRSLVYLRETTDSQGFFEFPMRGELDVDFDRALVVTHGSRQPSSDQTDSRAQGRLLLARKLSHLTQELPIRLGDIQLHPPELLLAGQVLDEQGVPLARVRIDFGSPAKPSKSWPWRHFDRVTTDKQGNYVLRAFERPAKLRVNAMRKGYASKIVEVEELGQRHFDIVLQAEQPQEAAPTGALQIALRTDPGVAPAYFQLLLTAEDGRTQHHPLFAAGETPLPIGHLAPGSYSADIHMVFFDQTVATVPDLTIRANETLTDGRLLPVDLRGKAKAVEWKILLPGGRPLREDKIKMRIAGKVLSSSTRTDEEGVLRYVLPTQITQVEISADRKNWVPATVGQSEPIQLPKPE